MIAVQSEVVDAALEYASRGWHTFPLQPRGKRPITVNGLKDATDDPGRITAMFRSRWDGSVQNVGINTGASGLLVVDLDGDEGMAQFDRFPDTLTATTGKGFHLYYQGEGCSTVRKLGPGIDTRGVGGYVVAPPSIHPEGCAYRWLDPTVQPVEMPPEVLAAVRPARRSARPVRRKGLPPYAEIRWAVERFRGARNGARNDSLNREVWITKGCATDEELAVLWFPEALGAGLGEDESISTIASALGIDRDRAAQWLSR